MPLLPGMRLSAHADLYKNDEQGRPEVLGHTSRRCHVCREPLLGPVIPVDGGTRQVHVECGSKI